jgi:hypothetical protein
MIYVTEFSSWNLLNKYVDTFVWYLMKISYTSLLYKKSSWDTYVLVYIKYFFILCESWGHGDSLS